MPPQSQIMRTYNATKLVGLVAYCASSKGGPIGDHNAALFHCVIVEHRERLTRFGCPPGTLGFHTPPSLGGQSNLSKSDTRGRRRGRRYEGAGAQWGQPPVLPLSASIELSIDYGKASRAVDHAKTFSSGPRFGFRHFFIVIHRQERAQS